MARSSSATGSWARRFPCCCDGDRRNRFGGRSLSGDLLPPPSLGAMAQQPPRLRKKNLVSPYDPRYKVWETFLILLVVYSAWICPLEFAFLRYLPRAPFVVDDVVNGFFAVDIVLTFFVPYVDSKSCVVVDDHRKIAARYRQEQDYHVSGS